MARKQDFTAEQVVEALKATGGLSHLAADRLGCSARSIRRYAQRYDSVRECVEHERGKRLDVAEAALWRAVLAGEAWAVCFFLKTQGKERGYVERFQHQHGEGFALEIVEEIIETPTDLPPSANGEAGR
jgi:hypothetical protein